MSDTFDAGAATDAAPEVTTTAPADTGTTAASDGFDPGPGDTLAHPQGDVFTRDYVERIRQEAASHRVRAKEYADRYGVFDAYEDADRQVWVDLATSWRDDPQSAAETMRRIADSVLGMQQQQAAEERVAATQEVLDLADEDLTPEQVAKLVDERLAERERIAAERAEAEAAVAEVVSQVEGAGFAKGTPDHLMVLMTASQNGGDVAKAIEQQKAYRQSIIDDYVKGKADSAAPVSPGGAPATTPTLDFASEEARRDPLRYASKMAEQAARNRVLAERGDRS